MGFWWCIFDHHLNVWYDYRYIWWCSKVIVISNWRNDTMRQWSDLTKSACTGNFKFCLSIHLLIFLAYMFLFYLYILMSILKMLIWEHYREKNACYHRTIYIYFFLTSLKLSNEVLECRRISPFVLQPSRGRNSMPGCQEPFPLALPLVRFLSWLP